MICNQYVHTICVDWIDTIIYLCIGRDDCMYMHSYVHLHHTARTESEFWYGVLVSWRDLLL